MRVTINTDTCQRFGLCCLEAEGAFECFDDGTQTRVLDVTDDDLDAVERAADICPTQSILIDY